MFYLPQEIKNDLAAKYGMKFNPTTGMLDNFFDVTKPRNVHARLQDGSSLSLNYANYFYSQTTEGLNCTIIFTESSGYFYFDNRMVYSIEYF